MELPISRKSEMIIDKLYVETSRRGSSLIKSSYKGESQNVVITKQILNNLFKDIDLVETLVIDGIEPLLMEKTIKMLFDAIVDNYVRIGNFVTFSTADVIMSNKSIDILDDLYYRCSKRQNCCLKVVPDNSSAVDYFKFDQDERIKHEFINQNLIDLEELISEHEGFYRNGFDIIWDVSEPVIADLKKNDERVKNVVHVSANGNVNSGEFLTFECADDQNINFGSVKSKSLKEILKENFNTFDSIVEMETGVSGEISFSQYWESLPEDKRGDWFGYIYGCYFNRDFNGYGLMKVVEDNPELSKLKDLSDIVTIIGLKTDIKPPWFTKNDEKWKNQVIIEFNGYMRLLKEMIFSKSPVLEMIDIYYHDFPYRAPKRLRSFIEKFIEKEEVKNAEKGNIDL